jgi:protein SCO1
MGAAIGIVVLFAIAIVVGQSSSPAPKPPSADVGIAMNSPLPANIMNLPLVDETGRTTNLAAFQGKIVVMTDFMTLCQEICPITTAALNEVDRSVTKAGLADKVQFVDVTVDPARDDPARLHAYRSFAKLLPNWTLLTGTPENLATLFHHFGVGYEKTAEEDPPGTDWLTGQPLTYDLTHTDVLIYLDEAGHQRFVIQGAPLGSNAPLTEDEMSFLNDEGHENLTNAADGSWTGEQALQVVSWLAKKHIPAAG